MKVQWTSKASSDILRLHEHLRPVAPEAAARVVQQLAHAPDRLLDYPRLGEKLEAFEPREVRRIIVGHYEMRYERSEEHTSELQSLMRISYAVFCLKKKKHTYSST